jgi:hypothetical protein
VPSWVRQRNLTRTSSASAAAFYSSLKSTAGLIAAKAAALRVNMNTDGCLIASSHAASRYLASSHASSLFHSSLTQPTPSPALVGRTHSHTSYGPSCLLHTVAQQAIPLPHFGHPPIIHPAVINRPVQNLRFPAAGATTPCRLDKS